MYIMSIPSVDEKEYKNIPQCLSWCGNVCVKRRSAICFVFFVVFKLFMASGYCDQSADKAANKEKK